MIFVSYIAESAPYMINISGTNRHTVEAKMATLLSHSIVSQSSRTLLALSESENHDYEGSFLYFSKLFKEAKREIFLLMESDSYTRYLATKDKESHSTSEISTELTMLPP